MNRLFLLVGFLGASFAALSLFAEEAGPSGPIRRVYVDQSHDFLFELTHLGQMFQRHAGADITISLTTFPPKDIQEFDAVVLHQWHKPIPFDEAAVKAIAEYVEKGGGLYVVANSVEFEKDRRPCPVAAVAARFGCDLKVAGKGPVKTEAGDFCRESFVLDQPKKKFCVLAVRDRKESVLGNVQVLAREAGGEPVAVVGEFGKGRIFLTTELAFAADTEREAQRDLMVKIIRWVSRSDDPSAAPRMKLKKAGYRRRNPELVLKQDGIEVLHTAYLKDEAALLVKESPKIRKAVNDFFQWQRSEPIKVITVTGGGFTDRSYVGIGVCDLSEQERRGLLLFETVNSTPTPAPTGLGEAWAVFIGRVLGPKLGTTAADEEDPWEKIREQVLPDDPKLDKFDISVDMRANPLPGSPKGQGNWVQFRKKKCALLLKELHDKHGVEFIRRFFRIHFATFDTPRTPDFDTWVKELSLAAGEDLTDFFRMHGTTVGDLKLPKTNDGIRQAADQILKNAERKEQASTQRADGSKQP
ncbi:MAG TPA: hypothetical protein PLP01_06260 [Phycisphaerae bacterium]|nr:hypothetical protein [Phycisphaerae bacterium]